MASLMHNYETYLADNAYVDEPGLVALAFSILSAARPPGEALYLVPDFLRVAPPEAQLINALAAGRLVYLPVGHVYEQEDAMVTPATDVGRLPWLYRPALAPPPAGDGSLNYFQAYGLRNEVREVYRRLLAGDIPLDQVTVAYTNSEYIPAFFSLSRRLGLGLTVAGGLPAILTGPGRILQGLLDWVRNRSEERRVGEEV